MTDHTGVTILFGAKHTLSDEVPSEATSSLNVCFAPNNMVTPKSASKSTKEQIVITKVYQEHNNSDKTIQSNIHPFGSLSERNQRNHF